LEKIDKSKLTGLTPEKKEILKQLIGYVKTPLDLNKMRDELKENDNGYRRLDFSKLKFRDKTVTSEEALQDVIPIKWSEKVLNGDRKVIISKFNKFINDNKEKINAITPKNPTLAADDEWREDNEWNRYYDNLNFEEDERGVSNEQTTEEKEAT